MLANTSNIALSEFHTTYVANHRPSIGLTYESGQSMVSNTIGGQLPIEENIGSAMKKGPGFAEQTKYSKGMGSGNSGGPYDAVSPPRLGTKILPLATSGGMGYDDAIYHLSNNNPGGTIQPQFLNLGEAAFKSKPLPSGQVLHIPLAPIMQIQFIENDPSHNILPHNSGVSSLPARLRKTYVAPPEMLPPNNNILQSPDYVISTTKIPDPPGSVIIGKHRPVNRKKDLYSQAKEKEALLKKKRKS